MGRSLQVPGSLSSPLTRMYFGLADSLGTKLHFMPVGKPAPPRPRRLEALTSLMMSSGAMVRAFCTALYPSSLRYCSMSAAPLPKRLETTLISSGWETRSAISLQLLVFSLSLVILSLVHEAAPSSAAE